MPGSIGYFALALVPVLFIATVKAGHRTPRLDTLDCWKANPAEPWGTIVLYTFLTFPLVGYVAKAIGLPALAPLGVLGVAAAITHKTNALHSIRRVTVTDSGIEIRRPFHRQTIALQDVLFVTGLSARCSASIQPPAPSTQPPNAVGPAGP